MNKYLRNTFHNNCKDSVKNHRSISSGSDGELWEMCPPVCEEENKEFVLQKQKNKC